MRFLLEMVLAPSLSLYKSLLQCAEIFCELQWAFLLMK